MSGQYLVHNKPFSTLKIKQMENRSVVTRVKDGCDFKDSAQRNFLRG